MTFWDWIGFRRHERLAGACLLVIFAGIAVSFGPLVALGLIGLAVLVAYVPVVELLAWEEERRRKAPEKANDPQL